MSYQRFKRRRSDSDNFMHISFRRGRNGEKEEGSKKKKKGGRSEWALYPFGFSGWKREKTSETPEWAEREMEHNGARLCHAGRRRDPLARRALYLGRGSFVFSGLRTTWGIQSGDDSMSENPKMSARTMLLRCLHARVSQKPHRDLMSATTGCLVCSLRYL